MPPVPGDAQRHRFEIHKRLKHRLQRTAGVTQVESEPSSMRPVRVRATLDTETFLDRSYAPTTATLEIEWRPRRDRDVFRIQYDEPGEPWSCGWHQDDTHEELGPSHFQVDHADWNASRRKPASFADPNPMAILETCLDELRSRLPVLPESAR